MRCMRPRIARSLGREPHVENKGRDERGVGSLTLLVFGLIFAAIVYVGFEVLPFFYYYYDLQNQMESMVRVASEENDETIRKRLLYYIHKYQMPVRDEQLRVYRSGGKIYLDLEYREVFYVSFKGKDYNLRVFPFHAHAEGVVETRKR